MPIEYPEIVAELMLLPRGTRHAILDMTQKMLAEAERREEAGAHPGIDPTDWTAIDEQGQRDGYESRSDALNDSSGIAWGVTELIGRGVVHQEFVVCVPIGDAAGMRDGEEYKSFPTRAEAEAYAKRMQE